MKLEKNGEKCMSEKEKNTDHDGLFKRLFHSYPKEFVEFCFPRIAVLIDTNELQPMPEQFLGSQGTNARLIGDSLSATKIRKTGEIGFLHIEFQGQPDKKDREPFPIRMYQYSHRINSDYLGAFKYLMQGAVLFGSYPQNVKHEVKITIPGPSGDDKDNYVTDVHHYETFHLRAKNWIDNMDTDNPVGVALLSCMKRKKDEQAELRLHCIQKLLKMGLQKEKTRELMAFSDSYNKMNKEQTDKYNELVTELIKIDSELGGEIMSMTQEFETKWHLEGRKEGKEEGKKEERKEIIFKLLELGTTDDTIKRATSITDEQLEVFKEEFKKMKM